MMMMKKYVYIWLYRGARNMQENPSEELTDEKFRLDEALGTCECHNSWKLFYKKSTITRLLLGATIYFALYLWAFELINSKLIASIKRLISVILK